MSFNIGLNMNVGSLMGSYGSFGIGFGYNSMNSMINNMFGGFGMGNYGMGSFGLGGMMGGLGGLMGGLGGMMGISGSMSLPIYGTSMGKAWDTTLATSLGKRDPVYLDTNHDGQLNVEKLKKSINFDMNGDGITDRVHEWNTKDAQLVYDANGDGQINSGREMMNEVGINGEQNKYKNGWEKARDLFDTNKDGILDAKELEKAKFWTDANGNGKVDEGELKSAAEMGIFGIDTQNGSFLQQQQIGNLNMNFGMNFGMGNMFGGYGMGNMFGGYGMGNMLGGYGMGNMFGGYGMGNMFGGYGMNSQMMLQQMQQQMMLQQLMMQQQMMFSGNISFAAAF